MFDGIGGFPYAASFFGIKTLWASEILPVAVSVTKRHMPDMEHVGDITQLDGGKLAPVDIITFGSPCQGLSTAGKRAGLSDPRSGLFSEAIRIIKEMRDATNGKYPRYAVWENVVGATSSNNGFDYKAVLEAFAETEVPFPKFGKWANAGMVRGGGIDIAWCVYNAQYFGVAQRRRRIFLVRDFRGESAGEILFIPKSLCGYFEAGGTPRKEITANACGGTCGKSTTEQLICLNDQERPKDIGVQSTFLPKAKIMSGDSMNIENTPLSPTLRSETHGNLPIITETNLQVAVGIHQNQRGEVSTSDTAYCVTPINTSFCMKNNSNAVGVHQGQDGTVTTAKTAYCLTTNSGASSRNAPLVAHTHPKVAGTLCASGSGLSRPGGMGSETDLCVVTPKDILCIGDDQVNAAIMLDLAPTITLHQPYISAANKDKEKDIIYSLQGNMIGRQDKNGPAGSGINEKISFTLSATDRHAIASANQHTFGQQGHNSYSLCNIASTQTARQYKSATDLVTSVDKQSIAENNDFLNNNRYTIRRLTPLECERLQGYPDGWTEFDADGKLISDTKRYQMLGNSIAVPCVAYIMMGIAEQFQKER